MKIVMMTTPSDRKGLSNINLELEQVLAYLDIEALLLWSDCFNKICAAVTSWMSCQCTSMFALWPFTHEFQRAVIKLEEWIALEGYILRFI